MSLFRYDIVQFGIARSGSTLCFNAIKFLAPSLKVKKVHNLALSHLFFPVIATLRDPFDSVVSLIEGDGLEITDRSVEEKARQLRDNGFSDRGRLKLLPRVLVLQYEAFHKDYRHLLGEIARFLKVDLTDERVEQFSEAFNVKKIREMTAGRPFSEVDEETKIHGSHVSSSEGASGRSSILTAQQRRIAEQILGLRR